MKIKLRNCFFVFFLFIIIFSFPVNADNEQKAEQTLQNVKSLSRSTISSLNNQIESEFGIKSVREEFVDFINLDQSISCRREYLGLYDRDKWVYVARPKDKLKEILRDLYGASEKASNNNYGVHVSPSEVYTILILEGFYSSFYNGIRDLFCNPDRWEKFPADSSSLMRMHNLGGEINNLKINGFLRQDFNNGDEYFEYNYRGKKPVQFGKDSSDLNIKQDLKSIEYALEAGAARIAWNKYTFLKEATELGIISSISAESELSEEQVMFWTYCYYQRPSEKTFCYRQMRDNKNNLNSFIRLPGQSLVIRNDDECKPIRKIAIFPAATEKLIRELNVFV